MDPRLAKLARVIVEYSAGVKKGDLVAIAGATVAEPLAVALYEEVLRAGAHPWIHLVPEVCQEIALKQADADQLEYLNPFDTEVVERADVRLAIWAQGNTKALSGVDPARQAQQSRAKAPLMARFMERAGLPEDDPKRLRWNGTLFPTPANAQDAEMSLRDYEDFVYAGGKLHHEDPVSEWVKLGEAQRRLADRMEKGREVHITAPNGTDIRFGVAGRRWINCDGHENFPDGEIFTGPIEDATEGTVCYSFPAVHGGREVNGIRLTFKAGKVVDASATHNEAFLIQMLDQDAGGRVLGELALGSNYDIRRYTKNTLFDEKIGGTFHAAVGAAYPESGGTNKSGLHWDMVCDLREGGVVRLDGDVISKDGRFTDPTWPQPPR